MIPVKRRKERSLGEMISYGLTKGHDNFLVLVELDGRYAREPDDVCDGARAGLG